MGTEISRGILSNISRLLRIMARRSNTHNRFSAELDSEPSRLDELTFHSRLEERERRAAGWRRNLLYMALIVAGVAFATFVTR